jgi:hypothetical protein
MKISSALRLIGSVAVLAGVTLTPAFAVDVIYSTTGQFTSCIGAVANGCDTTAVVYPNNLTITFTGTAASPPANVEVPDVSYAPFGTFTVTGPTAGHTDAVLADFNLTVMQTAPSSGTELVVDTVRGNIRIANSQVTVTFNSGSGDGGTAATTIDPISGASALSFNFGGTTYWVDTVTPIHPQTAGGTPGTSIINGAIDSTVPEPAFYALTGMGFASLLGIAIRRRRQQQA